MKVFMRAASSALIVFGACSQQPAANAPANVASAQPPQAGAPSSGMR